MSKQDEARIIAAGLTYTTTTTKGKVVAEVTTPTADDHRRVLAAFGRGGWKTSVKKGGTIVRAEVAL
jgi:hypothetical protein